MPSQPSPRRQRGDDIAYPPRTSMPEWPTDVPVLDASATSYTLFFVGLDDEQPRMRWQTDLTAQGIPFDIVEIDRDAIAAWLPDATAWFGAIAARHVVGWRVGIAGEEVAVLALQAAATSAGLLACEITAYVDATDRASVYCPHCKGTTLFARSTSATVPCAHCGRSLELHAHLSRRLGSYLGTVPRERAEGEASPDSGVRNA